MADDTDIDKLRELAEAATPGPWYCALSDRVQGVAEHTDEVGGQTYVFQDFICVTDSGMEEEPDQDADEATAAYIAAASPDVILALAAELVGLRTEVDQLRTDNERLMTERIESEDWKTMYFAARAERDTLQAQVAAAHKINADLGEQSARDSAVLLRQDQQIRALQARIDAIREAARANGRMPDARLRAVVAALGVDPQKEDGDADKR